MDSRLRPPPSRGATRNPRIPSLASAVVIGAHAVLQRLVSLKYSHDRTPSTIASSTDTAVASP